MTFTLPQVFNVPAAVGAVAELLATQPAARAWTLFGVTVLVVFGVPGRRTEQ